MPKAAECPPDMNHTGFVNEAFQLAFGHISCLPRVTTHYTTMLAYALAVFALIILNHYSASLLFLSTSKKE